MELLPKLHFRSRTSHMDEPRTPNAEYQAPRHQRPTDSAGLVHTSSAPFPKLSARHLIQLLQGKQMRGDKRDQRCFSRGNMFLFTETWDKGNDVSPLNQYVVCTDMMHDMWSLSSTWPPKGLNPLPILLGGLHPGLSVQGSNGTDLMP